MPKTKVVEKLETRILCSITLFRKTCHLWDKVKKSLESGVGHRWKYGGRALHAGYL